MAREIYFYFILNISAGYSQKTSAVGNEFAYGLQECLFQRDISTLLTTHILKNMNGHHGSQRMFDVFHRSCEEKLVIRIYYILYI